MEIYLIRHGQTDRNAEGRYSGQSDIPLNEKGREQARQLEPWLSDVRFDRVLTSTLQRTQETARLAAPGYEPEACEWLKEIDSGKWTGLTWKEAVELYPQETEAYKADWLHGICGGGESFADVAERVTRGIRELIREMEPTGTILIVTHSVPMRIIAQTLMKMPIEACLHLLPAQGVYAKFTAYPDPEQEPWFSMEAWNRGGEIGWRK